MDTPTLLIYIFVFLLGITVGSFLNVCILRIPKGESIVFGPSHCIHCGKRLKWYELIPIFSYLALMGRCSNCKRRISVQYPAIEALNGILWLFIVFTFRLTPNAVLICLLTSALIVLSIIDARTYEIPEGINIFIFFLGITATIINAQNYLTHIIGLFAISLPLYLIMLITREKGIGGGDIKLMAASGLFLGWKLIILAFFLSCLSATIIHLFLMTTKKVGRTLSFGPYLSIGIFIALIWGNSIINWYISLF